MFSDMGSLLDSVFSTMSKVFSLYTGSIVLSGVLALWLLRKVVKVIKHI